MSANNVAQQCVNTKHDVVFKFQASSFSCEKAIFGDASGVLKHVFEACDSGEPSQRFPGIVTKQYSTSDSLTLVVDEKADAFEAIHKYIHDPR